MTTTAAPPAVVVRPAPMSRSYRFELVKLFAQWRIRVLAGVCWIAPALVVAVVSRQSSLPSDTVFGRWMHATGWAGSLVVLGFSCSWVLPLLTSLVAGDVFAAEDRLGTWRHLLTAVRSPWRIFAAKTAASLSVIGLLVCGLTVSSIAGGLLAAGSHPLVGLDGHLLSGSGAAATVLFAWAFVLAPTLAFAAVGLLGSIAFGRSPMGLLTPALLALVLGLAQLMPLPVAVRMSLPSSGFLVWRGLFTSPVQGRELLIAALVDLSWAVAAGVLAYRLFIRRDFTDLGYDGPGRRALAAAALPLVALTALTAVAIGATTSSSGTGIGRHQLERSLATAYAHLYRLQTEQLHRPAVTEAALHTSASCDKGDGHTDDTGPGNDWRCVVSWRLPGSSAVGTATYQLDVSAEGRYVADGDGPKEVNGNFLVRTPSGDAPNPLWQFDGYVDLLHPI